MPIYEYVCKKCGKTSELLVSSSSSTQDIVCEHCGSKKLEKLISAPGSVRGGGGDSAGAADFCPTCSTGTCGLPPFKGN
jgi:putative FmdB family regulatory protein